MNVQGVCSNQSILNCATLKNIQTFTTFVFSCNNCANQYTLATNGTCVLGSVANCAQYSSPSTTVCTSCLKGFSLMSLTGSGTYCYPVPSTFNCNVLASSTNSPMGYAQGIITCSSCVYTTASPLKVATWASQTTTTLGQNICLPFNAIANCLTYSQASATILANTYLCTSCATGFYLSSDSTTCVTRTILPSNCATYNTGLDQCLTCNAGFFLNTTFTGCVAYPNGIVGCQIYSSATVCFQCSSGYYLLNNLCLLSTVISGCSAYSANYTCLNCSSGFYKNNSTSCLATSAVNCLTVASTTACGSCAFGYNLATSGSPLSCIQISITNCFALNPVNPTYCGYCNTGFYVTATGTCTAVTTTISNCQYYASATTCANCTATYILSVDKLSCSSFNNVTDGNCGNQILLSSPVCTQCSVGYTFSNGVCTACGLLSSGCLACDINNSSSCLICTTGYYMNSAGSCISTAVAPPTPVTPTTTASRMSVMLIISFVLLFFQFSRPAV